MRFKTLKEWLAWQETLNPAEIDLGLERVGRVLAQAKLPSSFDCPLITVAGTNGKGSVVAMLEAITTAAGLKVCSYTSPHFFHYNERIRINGRAVCDDALCEAFERIDRARADIPLTYFEFGTLAAIDLFFSQQPDLVILETGLGGRLDAVNVMDADISVITSIAIDHTDWLGEDRESIGYEKAGIFRPGRTVICGDDSPPESLIKHAQKLHCEYIQAGSNYQVSEALCHGEKADNCWSLKSCYGDLESLPAPSLVGDFQKSNAATAIVALQALLKNSLALKPNRFSDLNTEEKVTERLRLAATKGLTGVILPGRFQMIHTRPQVYVDVAHNPQAAQALASQLKQMPVEGQGRTWAIVAMLSDKDAAGVISNVFSCIDFWCFAGLENAARGFDVQGLVSSLSSALDFPGLAGVELERDLTINPCKILTDKVLLAKTVTDACKLVLSKADKNDRIVIFGSFYTVTEAMQFFSRLKNENVLSK